MFKTLYEATLRWSRHPRAVAILAVYSFLEAFILPVAPEVMLAPMCLAQPKRGFHFAALSLAFALPGALVGWAIGHFGLHAIEPWLNSLGYAETFEKARQMAAENGFWFLVIAGFVPVPFKIFTIAAGAVGMPLAPFVAGVLIGRGKRLFLVALLIRLGGERAEAWMHRYIEPIGYAVIALIVVGVAAYKLWHH
jgi:membrane protein YqaA with SNARE-associated domain